MVAGLGTKEPHKLRRRGAQSPTGYDPDMMLALLLYAYTHKVRSSPGVERLCETDVAFKVICAGHVPDHTTVGRFRQAHAPLCRQLFAQCWRSVRWRAWPKWGWWPWTASNWRPTPPKTHRPSQYVEMYRFPLRLHLTMYLSMPAARAGTKMIEQLGDHPRHGHRCL